MQILALLLLALVAVLITRSLRIGRDRAELIARIRERGAEVVRLQRARKGHPFPDTGRGWWAWRVQWRDESGDHVSWALTTPKGIKEWRD